jgi:4-hydroxy-tetrahydrodipicolinate synthase
LNLRGAITALVSPFSADGSIDVGAWVRLLERQFAAGCGVVVAGSTGESAALDDGEIQTLVAAAVAVAGPGRAVIAGCGASATHKAQASMARAAAAGATMALVVTPAYVRPTQEGLYRHYMTLADRGSLPVILYNVPTRTGCDLLPQTVARLAVHPNIIGIKEAVSDAARIDALLALRGEGFAVLSGDDSTATRSMLSGADGVISVASNVMPRAWCRLHALVAAGDRDAARALADRLDPVVSALGVEPNPIPVKWMLHALGLAGAGLRLPLTELSIEHRSGIEACARVAAAIEAEPWAVSAQHAAA